MDHVPYQSNTTLAVHTNGSVCHRKKTKKKQKYRILTAFKPPSSDEDP
jgi:hypothetical protein